MNDDEIHDSNPSSATMFHYHERTFKLATLDSKKICELESENTHLKEILVRKEEECQRLRVENKLLKIASMNSSYAISEIDFTDTSKKATGAKSQNNCPLNEKDNIIGVEQYLRKQLSMKLQLEEGVDDYYCSDDNASSIDGCTGNYDCDCDCCNCDVDKASNYKVDKESNCKGVKGGKRGKGPKHGYYEHDYDDIHSSSKKGKGSKYRYNDDYSN